MDSCGLSSPHLGDLGDEGLLLVGLLLGLFSGSPVVMVVVLFLFFAATRRPLLGFDDVRNRAGRSRTGDGNRRLKVRVRRAPSALLHTAGAGPASDAAPILPTDV